MECYYLGVKIIIYTLFIIKLSLFDRIIFLILINHWLFFASNLIFSAMKNSYLEYIFKSFKFSIIIKWEAVVVQVLEEPIILILHGIMVMEMNMVKFR